MGAPHPPETVLGWVRDVAGGAIASIRSMGVGSTTLHAIDARDRSGAVRRMVVRRFHDEDRLRDDPWYAPANEAAVLGLLDDSEVPAPRLLAADVWARACDVPALLTTRVAGRPTSHAWDMDTFLVGMAETLARIHEVGVPEGTTLRWYAPYYVPVIGEPRRPPGWSGDPALWERVFAVTEEARPATAEGFIHRDFHSGQLLWTGDRLTGVVDWTTGCRGPYGVDLARIRLSLALDYGAELAERLLGAYQRATGRDPHHPYWDLLDAADAILDLPPPSTQEAADRYGRFEQWVALALASL